MAEPESHATWEQLAKLALSIAAVAGILIVPRLDTPVTRPHSAPPLENHFVSAQDVDARLWQDPFEAIDAERQRRRETDTPSMAVPGARDEYAKRHAMERLKKDLGAFTAPSPVVLLALIPGGPYPEDSESRRRTRYATLSGLRAASLIPVDAEHLGYVVVPPGAAAKGLPDLVPYEWLAATGQERVGPIGASDKPPVIDRVLVLWLDERMFAPNMIVKVGTLLSGLGLCRPTSRASLFMLGPNESGHVRELVDDSFS